MQLRQSIGLALLSRSSSTAKKAKEFRFISEVQWCFDTMCNKHGWDYISLLAER